MLGCLEPASLRVPQLLFDEYGAVANQRGNAALVAAAKGGGAAAVRLLLQQPPQQAARAGAGLSAALFYAAQRGHEEVARVLLSARGPARASDANSRCVACARGRGGSGALGALSLCVPWSAAGLWVGWRCMAAWRAHVATPWLSLVWLLCGCGAGWWCPRRALVAAATARHRGTCELLLQQRRHPAQLSALDEELRVSVSLAARARWGCACLLSAQGWTVREKPT